LTNEVEIIPTSVRIAGWKGTIYSFEERSPENGIHAAIRTQELSQQCFAEAGLLTAPRVVESGSKRDNPTLRTQVKPQKNLFRLFL
jgi:hypothetical protein